MTAVLLGLVFALIGLVTIVAGGSGAGTAGTTLASPSRQALDDIPAILLPLLIDEAQQCAGMPWAVLAGISRVESDHGRHGGATIGPDGRVAPPIIGIALDGTGGTARITDTDDGLWDHDSMWDRAVGPFQFIPSSWRIFGGDGNGDGVADPNNLFDAVPATRRHLCPEGHLSDVAAAIRGYNHSDAYVTEVLAWAQRYTGALSLFSSSVAGHALPVAAALVDENALTRPHHDYPAWDLAAPVGTPVFAMADGTVVTAASAGIYPNDPNPCGTTVAIAGVDGAHYIYCHLSQLAVTTGQPVTSGTLIGLSGGAPNTPGAGNTTGPHIHLAIRFNGASVCPQPLLLATYRQQPFALSAAPTAGCIEGASPTNWPQWFAALPAIAPSP